MSVVVTAVEVGRPAAGVPPFPWDEQLAVLGRLAASHGLEALVLRDPLTLSWLTGARWHVPQTLGASCFDVVVHLADGRPEVRVVTNAVEAPRLLATELLGRDLVVEAVPWTADRATVLPSGGAVGSDVAGGDRVDVSAGLAPHRRRLTGPQRELLARLARDAARVTGVVARAVRPGDTERHLAGRLAASLLDEGMEPVALFAGADERSGDHRHPLATDRPVRDRVLLACCARRHGLVASVTRIASLRPLTSAGRDRYSALLRVEATLLDATRAGTTLGEVVDRGIAAYAEEGFAREEWTRHHQGGFTGLSPREVLAAPGRTEPVAEGAVLGWNPSGDGWKVEDTTLVTAAGPRPLTDDPAWPVLEVGGRRRPAVLES